MIGNKFSTAVESVEASGIRKLFDMAGSDSVNMGIGEPDFDTPQNIKDAAIRAIQRGDTGYTSNFGTPELREAIRNKMKRENGLDINMDEIIVTSGASEALYLSLASMINPGDEILVPNPGFVAYNAIVKMCGGKVADVDLKDDLSVDIDDVQKKIGPKTKAIILNSPNNPTGAVQSKEDIKALAELADDTGITIISDEVYEHFIYDGVHTSAAAFTGNVITINACSKTYAMTGWRLGYLAADRSYIDRMVKIHQYLQANACSISQAAAVEALNGPQDSVMMMRDEFRRRRDVLMEGFRNMGIKCVVPKGAFYAFPEIDDCETKAAELVRAGLLVVPGTAFGTKGDGHIRMSYACAMEDIRKAISIMEKVL